VLHSWIQNPLVIAVAGLVIVSILVLVAAIVADGEGSSGGGERYFAGPLLKISDEEVDLGTVQVDRWVHSAVVLTNTGDQPLRFREPPYIEVVEGCCAPTPVLGTLVLQPGESTTLSLQFSIPADKAGYYDFRVHLDTNDREQTSRTIMITSNWVTSGE
jgi:hypothetical protein